MNERDIERYLVKRVREAGGEVRKVKWIGRNGAPDRFVMLLDGTGREPPTSWWVELKAPGKLPTPAQAREHDRMRQCGMKVITIDSLEWVDWLVS